MSLLSCVKETPVIPKPNECHDCPMYQDGKGFVPDEIVEGSEVFVLGQNPGVEEERLGRPFVGKTGQVMLSKFFPVAGLRRGENVSIGNVLRCRWQAGNTLPSGTILKDSVAHCATYYDPPISTRLVVAQGGLALKALTGDWDISIMDWRGFLID